MLVTGLKELEILLDDLFEYKNSDIYDMREWVKNKMKKEGKSIFLKVSTLTYKYDAHSWPKRVQSATKRQVFEHKNQNGK